MDNIKAGYLYRFKCKYLIAGIKMKNKSLLHGRIREAILWSGVMLLVSCGGGSGESTPDGSTINVNYSKGPVSGATAVLLDGKGNIVAGPVTTVNGQAAFSNVTYVGLVFAKFNGGSYTDEATGKTVNLPSSFSIRSGVIDNSGTATLQLTATPLTEIGFQRAESAAQSSALALNSVNSQIIQVADEYGLEGVDLTTVAPAPLNAISGNNSSADRYGTVLAAITQQQSNANANPDSVSLQQYIDTNVASPVDTAAFTQAVNDLTSNTNTSSQITSTVISGVTTQVGISTYHIGASVTGLSGTLVLQNNGSDNLTITADGTYTFSTVQRYGSNYAVTVLTQPTGQTCQVGQGGGAVSGADIKNITVSCSAVSAKTAVWDQFNWDDGSLWQ